MVSDISSVVSDFIASGKPYAVTDSAELGAEEFRRQNTAVRAAVILGNERRGARPAPRRRRATRPPTRWQGPRRELKEYLLGPDEPTSIEQFNTAVGDLALKAEARNVGQASLAVAPDDMPDGETTRRRTAKPSAGQRRHHRLTARVAEGRVPGENRSETRSSVHICEVEHGCGRRPILFTHRLSGVQSMSVSGDRCVMRGNSDRCAA